MDGEEGQQEAPNVAVDRSGGIPSVTHRWDISLAAQNLEDARSAFQALVRGEHGDVSPRSLPTVGEDHDNAEEEDDDGFEENDEYHQNKIKTNKRTRGSVSATPSFYAPPRKNRFIPPHKRPRSTRREYRLSPLEPVDDEKLIPDLQIENIASAIPAAVERERLFEQHPLPLLFGKRLWRYEGLDYHEQHPMGGYGGGSENVTPDDWPGDVNLDDDGGRAAAPWPLGTPYNASVFSLCWNYFRFTYNKCKTASNKVVFWEVIASFIPPTCSFMFGTGLIDELSANTAHAESKDMQMLHAGLYAVGIFLLQTLASYLKTQPLHCGYSINGAPMGAARAGLRDTLFHRMRHLKSPLRDKITPGGASGIIVDKVFDTVNIYWAFLSFPSLITGILANFAVSFSSLRDVRFTGFVIVPTVVVIFLTILLPIIINFWYQPELCILTRLEHQWRLRLRAVAGSAIPVNKVKRVTSESTHSNGGSSERTTEEDMFRMIFHQCSYLENMRHFHSWKMTVVILYLISVLTTMGIAIVTICAAHAVIHDNGITVGNFSTLVSSVSGIVKLGSEIGSFFTNMYENHTMLKQITCIMNDEDIGFDGGTDPFGSAHTGIRNTEKQALEKIKHAYQHHHQDHHSHDIELDLSRSDLNV